MAVRIYALESMIYRSAGMMDAFIHGAGAGEDKTQHLMKALEEYAIESSISKVYGSEALDFVVDEAVQIYGGYGFHEDYPVARAYRDSRINRIFEGTNEINRMLIIQMLMKRAMGGTLPLIPKAMKLMEEILAGPSFEEASTEAFAEEQRIVANAKKVFLLAAGSAVQKLRDKLADPDNQEIVAALANIAMDVYGMESSLLRAEKSAAARSGSAGALLAAMRAFLAGAADRVEFEARTVLGAVAEGDMLRTQLLALKRFSKREAANPIALRREVAAAVLSGDRYPFEYR